MLETLTGTGTGTGTLLAFAAALVLKPVLTALFLGAGAVGGILTPALSTGVALGTVVALCANHFGAHVSVATLALVGGATVLGITQRAHSLPPSSPANSPIHPPTWVVLAVAAAASHLIGIRLGRDC